MKSEKYDSLHKNLVIECKNTGFSSLKREFSIPLKLTWKIVKVIVYFNKVKLAKLELIKQRKFLDIIIVREPITSYIHHGIDEFVGAERFIYRSLYPFHLFGMKFLK